MHCIHLCLDAFHRRVRQRLPHGIVSVPIWSVTRRRCRVTSVGSCCQLLTSPTTWGSTTSRSTMPATSATAVRQSNNTRLVKFIFVQKCILFFKFVIYFFLFVWFRPLRESCTKPHCCGLIRLLTQTKVVFSSQSSLPVTKNYSFMTNNRNHSVTNNILL